MSFKARIILSNALDQQVYFDWSCESIGDYTTIPDLIERVTEEAQQQLARIGAYGLVNGGFAKPGDRDDAR